MPYLGVKPADITSATEAEIAGDLTVDTNTLHVDAANNRVGVGTTSPADHLAVVASGANAHISVDRSDGATGRTVLIHSSSGGQLQTTGSVPLIFGTADTERGRFLSGGGLTFNGDTAAANALDDYEEGTYTPQISATDGIGTLAYSTQVGTYTKIGNTVTFQLFIQVSSKGTVAGTIRLTLPFTAANVTNAFQSAAVRNDNVTGGSFSGNEQGGRIHANENIIRLDVIGSGTRSNFTAGNLLNNTNFIVSGSYRVN